jgi:hypothetical protein
MHGVTQRANSYLLGLDADAEDTKEARTCATGKQAERKACCPVTERGNKQKT